MMGAFEIPSSQPLVLKTQRWLRNYYYHFKNRKSNIYFSIFDEMYQCNKEPFPWIHVYGDKDDVYLSTRFISLQLSKYCGFELSVFSRYSLASYWLPGAASQAKGIVKPGDHYVSFKVVNDKNRTYLLLEKTDEHSVHLKAMFMSPDNETESYTFLACNALDYALYNDELIALIHHWLTHACRYVHDPAIPKIISQCTGISNKIDVLVSEIQAIIRENKI